MPGPGVARRRRRPAKSNHRRHPHVSSDRSHTEPAEPNSHFVATGRRERARHRLHEREQVRLRTHTVGRGRGLYRLRRGHSSLLRQLGRAARSMRSFRGDNQNGKVRLDSRPIDLEKFGLHGGSRGRSIAPVHTTYTAAASAQ